METKKQVRPLRKILPIIPLKKELLNKKMAISLRKQIEIIDLDHILYLKSDSNYTEIHLKGGKKIVSSITLKRYVNKLSSDRFIRVHQSYLINKSSISSYLTNQNKVVLHNSQEIPVSNSKKDGLLKYLKTLMV
ncbi:LytR/AlgR family response regulator transcription factor [Portibacter lacus]|uniref:LytR/AlgR family response regulator transcription factor n=1 Tax=Portibacter lacus TaxID=1099794 RepID=UPI001F3C9CCC|nr:LytTR family DNA-binding domain-containing protein [Portibacter lacus]